MLKIFMTVGLTIGVARHRRSALILGAIFLFFRQGVVNFIQLVTGQNLWDPSVRFLTELPSKTDPFEVTAIVADGAGPDLPRDALSRRWKAASTDPVQVLRYE